MNSLFAKYGQARLSETVNGAKLREIRLSETERRQALLEITEQVCSGLNL